jgi:hypothetical protein
LKRSQETWFTVFGGHWSHNSIIFRDKDIPLDVIAGLVIKITKEYMVDHKVKIPRNLVMPVLDGDIPWGYFDCASEGHPPICRVGEVLFLNQSHFIYIKYAPGRGSNNRAEFITL